MSLAAPANSIGLSAASTPTRIRSLGGASAQERRRRRSGRCGPRRRAITAEPADGTDGRARADPPRRGLRGHGVERAELPLRYRLKIDYGDGGTFTIDDPYAFLPTLGELDLHLIAEGRHEELYDKLGAHVRELDTDRPVAGTAFAVWAPAARAVSVVGDFNSWDGRLHAMRSLGSSGIWELFLPDVGPGARYKYEILAADGELTLKADPYAQETEMPPKTASVVSKPSHRWSDADAAVAARAPGRPAAAAARCRSTRSTSARGG